MTEPDPLKRLLSRAGRLLARRAYSRGDLQDKLRRMGDDFTVEQALARLEDLNLLNDAEYAYNLATHRMKVEGWGPIKVKDALLRRHVAPDLAESAIERVLGEVGDEAVLEAYVEKSRRTAGLPQDRKEIRKLVQRLRQRGFHEDTIRSFLRRRIPAAAWQHFETGE
jgi:regulatory protein